MAAAPKTVKELLAESKDTSELMVDLAYASLFFNDPKLAAEVDTLEELMGQYSRELRLISMLAARSRDDAEALTDVLHLAACIEQIADAAGPVELRDSARLLVRSMRRGVVSYAPEMDADEGDDDECDTGGGLHNASNREARPAASRIALKLRRAEERLIP